VKSGRRCRRRMITCRGMQDAFSGHGFDGNRTRCLSTTRNGRRMTSPPPATGPGSGWRPSPGPSGGVSRLRLPDGTRILLTSSSPCRPPTCGTPSVSGSSDPSAPSITRARLHGFIAFSLGSPVPAASRSAPLSA
jgi:hypothetical protein